MSDAFREINTLKFNNQIVFVTGFGVVADQPFQVGSTTTQNSNLVTYDQIIPWDGISGHSPSGLLINSDNFVKTTGAQTILGVKSFTNDLKVNSLASIGNNSFIDMTNKQIWDNDFQTSLDWQNRFLYTNTSVTSVDWNNRILSGTWNVQSLRMSGVSVATGQGGGGGGIDLGAYQPVFITGNQNINGLKTFSGAIFTGYFSGINLTGRNMVLLQSLNTPSVTTQNISQGTTDSNLNLTTQEITDQNANLSISWFNRTLSDQGPEIVLDWQNKQLYSTWTSTGINVLSSLKISGQSVITGGSFISSGEYYRPTQLYSGFNPINIDWSSGNVFKYVLTGNVAFNHVNHRDGQTIVVGVSNSGTGWYSGLWSPVIHWPFDIVPFQSSGSKMDVYTFIKITTGIYGSVVQGFGN